MGLGTFKFLMRPAFALTEERWGALLSQIFRHRQGSSNKKFQTKFCEIPSFPTVLESQHRRDTFSLSAQQRSSCHKRWHDIVPSFNDDQISYLLHSTDGRAISREVALSRPQRCLSNPWMLFLFTIHNSE